MNVHINTSISGLQAEYGDEYKLLFRKLARLASWRIFPYGWWVEHDGAVVVFDRRYRPICRRLLNGSVEIVSPETWITFTPEVVRFDFGYV